MTSNDWHILPSKNGWRVWSILLQRNVVRDVTFDQAVKVKADLEAVAKYEWPTELNVEVRENR